MNENTAFAIGVASVWIATAAAVCAGLYFTRNPNCLWGMLIPVFVSFSANKNKGDN